MSDSTKQTTAMKHGLFLTVGNVEDGRMIAIISDGSPQHGHTDITVLSLEVVKSKGEANAWFAKMMLEKPWETAGHA